MSRPLPKEVRPGFGALVEGVTLLARQETIEVAALLAAGGIAFPAIRSMFPGALDGTLYLPIGVNIPLRWLGFAFLDCAFQSGLLFFLVPVAAGSRGLGPRSAFAGLGIVGLVASVVLAVQIGSRQALAGFVGDGWRVTGWLVRGVLSGLVPALLVVWSAWFLGNAVRRRRDEPVAKARLLLHPGLLAVLLTGTFGCLIPWTGMFGVHRLIWQGPTRLAYQAVLNFGWGLCVVFAALWMLRAVENEAEADPAPGR